MLPKIKVTIAKAMDLWNQKLVPCGRKYSKFANVQARKVAETTGKTATKVAVKVKSYAVEETGKLCEYLAANEIPADKMEPYLKAAYNGQSLIGVDYTISEDLDEPVESIFQKARCLWNWMFNDHFFIFRRVKRRIRKNKKVSKRNIRALEEDEFLEALKLSLKVENTGFILWACGLRGIPERFHSMGLYSKNLDVVKMIAEKFPEEAASPGVLCFLAEAREFKLCQKLLKHVETFGEEHSTFVKQLIHRMDVNDYEGWQVLDWLLKESKLEYYTLKVIFLEVAKVGYWLNFEEWRTSRRSSTFLFIYFVV